MNTETEPDNQNRVTIAQAVAASGVHANTIRRWLKAGKLPGATKDGQPGQELWLLDLDEVLRVAAAQKAPAAPNQEPSPTPLTMVKAADLAGLVERLVERNRDLERHNAQLETELRLLKEKPPEQLPAPTPTHNQPLPVVRPWWRRWLG